MATTQELCQKILDSSDEVTSNVRALVNRATTSETAILILADRLGIPRYKGEGISAFTERIADTLENKR